MDCGALGIIRPPVIVSYDPPTYALDGACITIEVLTFTELVCLEPAGAMEQEQRYLGFLRDVTAYRVEGSQLWLKTDGGRILSLLRSPR
jgi:heat shock protein HslJ